MYIFYTRQPTGSTRMASTSWSPSGPVASDVAWLASFMDYIVTDKRFTLLTSTASSSPTCPTHSSWATTLGIVIFLRAYLIKCNIVFIFF